MNKLKQLESFVSIAPAWQPDGCSATPRAWRPPSWAGRLDALEERLGVKLLLRTTRRITLTHEGSAFLEDRQRILADLANAEASVQCGRHQGQRPPAHHGACGLWTPPCGPLVPRFQALHPEVHDLAQPERPRGGLGCRGIRLRGAGG